MRTKKILLSALLGALGPVAMMAQTNVDSINTGASPVAGTSRAAAADPTPKFDDLYQVLSAHLEGVTPGELNRAAVRGLLDQLGPRVSLVEPSAAGAPSNSPPLARSCVFDSNFAYFRPAAVAEALPAAFRAAYREMLQTNKPKIKGLVLDLRFAGGFDYPAAAKVADCFLNSDRPLLNWQSGSARATTKTDAISVPVAILVNSQTAGAAEVLAAVLRDTDVGLILGAQTAGQASIFKEFTLQNGLRLRVAVGQLSLGSGRALAGPVLPDIAISSSLDDQRAYLLDPYKVLHPPQPAKTDIAANPLPDQPRMNETELIREHKEGDDADDAFAPVKLDATPSSPVVADPALARALDLLKGLAVVEPTRPG
jgi:hypothetical protein